MTVGEYLSVFASFILALAVAEVVMGLHRLLRHRAKVRWDWMSLAFALLVMINIITFWWATYRWYGADTNPSILGFLPDVAMFVVLYLMAAAVLPDEELEEGLDLREFYVAQARYIWSLQVVMLLMVIIFVGQRYSDGWSELLMNQRDNIIAAVILSYVAWTKRTWVHQVAIVGLIALAIFGWLNMRLDETGAQVRQDAETMVSKR